MILLFMILLKSHNPSLRSSDSSLHPSLNVQIFLFIRQIRQIRGS